MARAHQLVQRRSYGELQLAQGFDYKLLVQRFAVAVNHTEESPIAVPSQITNQLAALDGAEHFVPDHRPAVGRIAKGDFVFLSIDVHRLNYTHKP